MQKSIQQLCQEKLVSEKTLRLQIQQAEQRADAAEKFREKLEKQLESKNQDNEDIKNSLREDVKRLRQEIADFEKQQSSEGQDLKGIKMKLEIAQGESQSKQGIINDLKKENEDLRTQLKENVTVGKLDINATQQFEKNPLDDKVSELEAGIKVLQDKIASKDKEVQRLKDDLENATRQTEAAV